MTRCSNVFGFRVVCPFSLSLWARADHVTSPDGSCAPAAPAAASAAAVVIELSKVTLTVNRVIRVDKCACRGCEFIDLEFGAVHLAFTSIIGKLLVNRTRASICEC